MSYLIQSGKQACRSIWKKVSRKCLRTLMYFYPEERKNIVERWFRGREQCQNLELADVVIVSYGKSGRTWLRVMLSRVYQQMHRLPLDALISFDNFHGTNKAIPSTFFTHDNYIKDYTGHKDSKIDFYGKKVVLLARDPRDVAVSQFFQWKYRMKSYKKMLNEYPADRSDVSVFDFVMDSEAGAPKIIDFLNLWANEKDHMGSFFLLRYEDLKSKPGETLHLLLEFLGTPATDKQIQDAVDYSSYENMKKLEQKNTFWLSGNRMVPKDRSNPHSYKVRRGKVGGYRDYFEDQQVEIIDSLIETTLSPLFKY